ncbi:MAG: AAA family ATPase [Candidatus Thorarchaeota archaeon]|nr:AAA family ATPase [Candidatus Thorarchaeota archaeon]
MKIAVTGKGGCGKTTIAGTLARMIGRDGVNLLAVDADPNYNLWMSLGLDENTADSIVPLLEQEELVKERTTTEWVKALGGFFRKNPRVADLAEKFAVSCPDNVRLLVAGTVNVGGSGCMCPSAALLKALIRHLSIRSNEAFLMDMDAGIEHLGRGTTTNMEALIAVVEPSRSSIRTLDRIGGLAGDIGHSNVFVIGNKVRSHEDRTFIEEEVTARDFLLIGMLPDDEKVRTAGRNGEAPLDYAPDCEAIEQIRAAKSKLEKLVAK